MPAAGERARESADVGDRRQRKETRPHGRANLRATASRVATVLCGTLGFGRRQVTDSSSSSQRRTGWRAGPTVARGTDAMNRELRLRRLTAWLWLFVVAIALSASAAETYDVARQT